MGIGLGRKLEPMVNFYLHGGTCILMIILNFLRPFPQKLKNFHTNYLSDLLVSAGVFTIYSVITALHYARFRQHVYPFLRKIKSPVLAVLGFLGCTFFYFGCIAVIKNLILIF